jgi:hypothetical protein
VSLIMLSGFSRTVILRTCLKLRDVSPGSIIYEIIEIVQQSRTPHQHVDPSVLLVVLQLWKSKAAGSE